MEAVIRARRLGFFLGLLTLLLTSISAAGQHSQPKRILANEKRCEACGVRAWVIANELWSDNSLDRLLYLSIDPADFTVDGLNRAFIHLADQFPDPSALTIYAYSDRRIAECKAMIDGRVRWQGSDHTVNMQKWQSCAERLIENPTSPGIAIYLRTGDGAENFSYNPDPGSFSSSPVPIARPYTGDDDSDLRLAASKEDMGKADALLSRGANPNAKDAVGQTALMGTRSPEMVTLLIKGGADVNAKNIYGVGALGKAAILGDVEIAKVLLEAGARPNDRDCTGGVPLMGAAMAGREEIVDLLLAAGADPGLKGESGRTAADMTRSSQPGLGARLKALERH